MKRAILLLAGLACCAETGCDSPSTAKMILTVGLNTKVNDRRESPAADVISTEARPVTLPPRVAVPPPAFDTLLAAMQELAQLQQEPNADDGGMATRLTEVIDRITESARDLQQHSADSRVLVVQAQEATAAALDRAAAMLPTEFVGRRDTFCQATFGRPWDRSAVEKQAINRLVTGYLVAPRLPADVSQVLALHAVTFPRHAMNVELYTTIAERLAGERSLLQGIELARAGMQSCADHSDVDRLQDRLKRIFREHPGEIGVPMNFAGPTMRERRFKLSSLRGQPVLVVFWSATDPVSDEFVVSCNRLARRYSKTSVEVVGVCLDGKLEDVEFWYHTHGFPSHHVFSGEIGHEGFKNPIARFFGVTKVPQFFMLDRDGIVIARGAGDLRLVEKEFRKLAPPNLVRSGR